MDRKMVDAFDGAAEPARAILAKLCEDGADPKALSLLSDELASIWNAGMEVGARQQGRVIAAAITGDLTAWPGCAPFWERRVDADECVAVLS